MRRTVLLALALCAVLSTQAAAWVETAAYDAPGDATADCLRAAGPERLSLLAPLARTTTPLNLLALSADRGSLVPAAHTDLGRLGECPVLATAPGADPLLVGLAVRGSHGVVRVAAPGAGPTDVPGAAGDVGNVSAAVAPGGAAVIAWLQAGRDFSHARLLAAVRPPGGVGFGAPHLLDDAALGYARPSAGIDAAGRATVAWLHPSPRSNALAVARLANAPAGGGFGAPQTLGHTWGERIATAVAPNGRALVATEAIPSMRAYERLPGAARFTRIHIPDGGAVDELAVALGDDGGAVIAYRNDETSVFAMTRAPGSAFFDKGAVVPVDERGGSGAFFAFAVGSARSGPAPPPDGAAGDLAAALGSGGAVLLTWVDDAAGGAPASAHVAQGTLAAGFGRPSRLGSPCRPAAASRPLPLLDGGLGVAWTDDARAYEIAGSTIARGGGRVHVALHAAAASKPRPSLPAPDLTARLADTQPLGAAEPLRVRVACRAACEVRASVTARSLPQPRSRLGGGRGGEPLPLAASTALPAGGSAVLGLRSFAGFNAAGVRGRPRMPIAVIACSPSGPLAQRMRLAPPPVRLPRPIPRLLDLAAHRLADGAVHVSWRTSIPARYARFTVVGLARENGPPTAVLRRRGRGRTRFAVTLPRPRAGRVRRIYLEMQQAEVLGAYKSARVH